MYKTAVVILNWNGAELLPEYLPALLKYTRIADTGLFVADNGSTDDSLRILKEQFPEVEVIDLKVNHGFALGYKYALEQVEAKYVVLLNSDVEVTENWLEPMVAFMEANPKYAALQPKILSHTHKASFEYAGAAGGELDVLGYPFARGRIFDTLELDQGQYDATERGVFWASGACVMVRAEALTKTGGLDTDFWAHMEEIDLCWRLHNAGYDVGVAAECRVYHLGGGSLEYGSPRKLYLNFRNNLFMLLKNLPTSKLYLIFFRMCLDGVAAFAFLAMGNPKSFVAVLRAHWHFYTHFRLMWGKRKLAGGDRNRGFVKLKPYLLLWQYHVRKKRVFSELEGRGA